MALLRYISHPEVDQNPDVLVPNWSLSEVGRRRAEALLDQAWIPDVTRIVSSAETKAREAAALIGHRLGVEVEVREATGETDRTATGYVPRERHDELARRLFDKPTESADGWERAVDAQARVAEAVADILVGGAPAEGGDVVTVGHGGVGSFLFCHLSGLAIDHAHEPPGQGYFWTWDLDERRMLHRWHPVDDLSQPPPF